MPFLLIGAPDDDCCCLVGDLLRTRGEMVVHLSEPLTESTTLFWSLTTSTSESHLCLSEGISVYDDEWDGILVRSRGELLSSEGWLLRDVSYVQQENQAALLAWLWSLPCPVVNQIEADLWFRPIRSLAEWLPLFHSCNLPTPAFQVTNDLDCARRFADTWSGAVAYTPLASRKRYTIDTPEQWEELAKLIRTMPVALQEPSGDWYLYATVLHEHIFWSQCISHDARARLESGLFALCRELNVEFLQVELAQSAHGLICLDIRLFPDLRAHPLEQRQAIARDLLLLFDGKKQQRSHV